MEFGSKIIAWYRENKRDLPWRNTRDPYLIWLSEIILQQTRVDQGLPYFLRFSNKYPNVRSLAKAPLKEVLKLWQGLGYYSRARNMHKAAQTILQSWKGKFPEDYEQIRSLPGIGDYTSAAIASFAFDLPHAVVDGNVYRLLSRFFGIDSPIDTTEGKKRFSKLANQLLQGHSAHDFNQSIMEFGALQCKPQQPDCNACPLHNACFAFEKGMISELPVKSKQIRVRERYLHYLHIEKGNSLYVQQRGSGDIWTGLYEFPLIETAKDIKPDSLKKAPSFEDWFSKAEVSIKPVMKLSHQLSHQLLHVNFYKVNIEQFNLLEEPKAWEKVNLKKLKKLPVSRLMEKYLKSQFPWIE